MINVAQQETDPDSVLAFYRRMIALRQAHSAVLAHGIYSHESSGETNDIVYIFTKTSVSGEWAIVVTNWTETDQTYTLPSGSEGLRVVLDTGHAREPGRLSPLAVKIDI